MSRVILAVVLAGIPILAVIIEWTGDLGISERHHSHHDTYVVSSAFTRALVFAMIFMGGMGLIFCWLCEVGVFRASSEVVASFFAAFLVVMFVMWFLMRRYKVVTYDDRMDVTPFIGHKREIHYDDITAMTWANRWTPAEIPSVHVMVGGHHAAMIWSALDVEQILQRINRYDVLENVR